MGRQRLTKEQRDLLHKKLDDNKLLADRKRRLLKRYFKKTPFYRTSFVLRLLFVAFFISSQIFKTAFPKERQEIVVDYNISSGSVSSSFKGIKYQGPTLVGLSVTTEHGCYAVDPDNITIPKKGQAIIVTRNLFNQPIYLQTSPTDYYHPISTGFVFYVLIVIITLASLLISDPTNMTGHVGISIVLAINISAIIVFLVG